MIEKTRQDIPTDHPIQALFTELTEQGMSQLTYTIRKRSSTSRTY